MRSCRQVEDTILRITNPSRRYLIPTVKETFSAAKRCGAPQVSDFECTTFFFCGNSFSLTWLRPDQPFTPPESPENAFSTPKIGLEKLKIYFVMFEL